VPGHQLRQLGRGGRRNRVSGLAGRTPPAEPVFGRGVFRLPGPAPDRTRRHLDQWHVGAHALGQGGGRMIRPLRRQRLAEPGERHRLGPDPAAARRGPPPGVPPPPPPARSTPQTPPPPPLGPPPPP